MAAVLKTAERKALRVRLPLLPLANLEVGRATRPETGPASKAGERRALRVRLPPLPLMMDWSNKASLAERRGTGLVNRRGGFDSRGMLWRINVLSKHVNHMHLWPSGKGTGLPNRTGGFDSREVLSGIG